MDLLTTITGASTPEDLKKLRSKFDDVDGFHFPVLAMTGAVRLEPVFIGRGFWPGGWEVRYGVSTRADDRDLHVRDYVWYDCHDIRKAE